MIGTLFLSLPVADIERAQQFFTVLGFGFHPKFTSDRAACLQLGEQVNVMLMPRAVFESFAHKPVPDPMSTTQHLLAVTLDTREAVDAMFHRAIEAGATVAGDTDDYGYMYQRAFHDPDGHPWAITWLDESQMPATSA